LQHGKAEKGTEKGTDLFVGITVNKQLFKFIDLLRDGTKKVKQ